MYPIIKYLKLSSVLLGLTFVLSCSSEDDPAPPPTADFSASTTSIEVGQTVNFTNLSENAEEYNWTFTGGTPSTSTLESPSITYNTEGNFTVTLEASNGETSDIETKTSFITVVEPTPDPVAQFIADNTSVLVGETVTFSNTSSGSVSFAWTFEGGSPSSSNSTSPSISYASAGSYDVTLVATNADGVTDTETRTDYITVLEAPVADFTANVTEITVGESVEFTSTATNASIVTWTFQGGSPTSSSSTNPTVTYNSAGLYTVTLRADNNAATDTETKVDYIKVNEPDFTAFAWANSSTSSSYSPNSSYSYNSSGGDITIQRSSIGKYQVTFAGVKNPNNLGHAQASPYGSNNRLVTISDLTFSGDDVIVDVSVFSSSGTPTDGLFNVYYSANEIDGGFAVVLESGAVNNAYSFNGSGGSISASRPFTGDYETTFSGESFGNGIGLVTPLQTTARHATITSFGSDNVDYDTYNAAGTKTNANAFIMALGSIDYVGGYGYATNTSTLNASVNLQNSYNSTGGSARVVRIGTGTYYVYFGGLAGSGNTVLVTGAAGARAEIGGWGNVGGELRVQVRTYNSSGSLSSAPFFIYTRYGE